MSWESVTPIHALGNYTVDFNVFRQFIAFIYHDPEGFFTEAVKSISRLKEETSRFAVGMEEILSKERVMFNGEEVKVKVANVTLSSEPKRRLGFVNYVLESKVNLSPGEENTYENTYEPGVAEYGYEVIWVFPPGTKVLEVVSPSKYKVHGHIVTFLANRGDEYDGYESIRFRLPKLRSTQKVNK